MFVAILLVVLLAALSTMLIICAFNEKAMIIFLGMKGKGGEKNPKRLQVVYGIIGFLLAVITVVAIVVIIIAKINGAI